MSTSIKNERWSWSEDLMASRDLSKAEVEGFGFLLGWFEEWRARAGLSPGRSAAERFWKEAVKGKARQEWQLDQWADALGWYLRWLQHCVDAGGDGRGVAERMKAAVHTTGARRGLALATRRTYAGWVGRFGAWAGTVGRVIDETVCRDWLAQLVAETKVRNFAGVAGPRRCEHDRNLRPCGEDWQRQGGAQSP